MLSFHICATAAHLVRAQLVVQQHAFAQKVILRPFPDADVIHRALLVDTMTILLNIGTALPVQTALKSTHIMMMVQVPVTLKNYLPALV